MRDDRPLLVVLVGGAVLWTAALVALRGAEDSSLIDLAVYRTGGFAWLHGVPLYGADFPGPLPGPRLPFTYPPLAAMIFAGLAVLPWWSAVAVVTGGGAAALALACRLIALPPAGTTLPPVGTQPPVDAKQPRAGMTQPLAGANQSPAGMTQPLAGTRQSPAGATLPPAGVRQPDRQVVALLVAAALAVAPLLEPVRETLRLGQVNLVLLGMITADCLLRRTPWPRGAMIGLAAAVKLTPAAFVLFFLARRQWRPAVTAAATFGAAALAGLLIAPRDSLGYWTSALFDPTRIGHLEFAGNQSLRGVLHRLELPAGLEIMLWLGSCAAVVTLALRGVRALRERGDEPAALLVTAAAALLVSPVSWSHHWVWAVPGLLWLGRRAVLVPSRAGWLLPVGVLAVFMSSPFWSLPYRDGREFGWTSGQHLLGDAYLWVGLAVVLASAAAAALRPQMSTTERASVTAAPERDGALLHSSAQTR
jgi:alpha-1,2-mannosyltransferase